MTVGRAPSAPAAWRSLFAVAEFRGLWAAQALSVLGDQLARVALSVLVFDRTDSALLTGLVYAVTMLPWLIGGPVLSGLADRYPRRTVMLACALSSAALVAALALPGLPLVALVGLLFLAVRFEPPFQSARGALLVEVLPDDRYLLASTAADQDGHSDDHGVVADRPGVPLVVRGHVPGQRHPRGVERPLQHRRQSEQHHHDRQRQSRDRHPGDQYRRGHVAGHHDLPAGPAVTDLRQQQATVVGEVEQLKSVAGVDPVDSGDDPGSDPRRTDTRSGMTSSAAS